MTQNDGAMLDANPASETMLLVPWVVFASGQGLRAEYATTASASVSPALEEEVSALCREFHNALGVQEVPEGLPVALFWKTRESSDFVLTHVLRTPRQGGERIAYEYFSLALTENDLTHLGGNPLRALELVNTGELRERASDGIREPFSIPISDNQIASTATTSEQTTQFFEDGIWPATRENREALLGSIGRGGFSARTFATWWPGGKPPRPGVFAIVLRSDAARVARPHEILALATELNGSLSRSLIEPPSYDTTGGRAYRTLLHTADEVQAMLGEAYSPSALEESPHRWMLRTQKVAGLCQKVADELPEYAARLPESYGTEMARESTDLAGRYAELARELQKMRHPNMLHQGRGETGTATGKEHGDSAQGTNRTALSLALVLGCVLVFCLVGFGVRALVSGSNSRPNAQFQPARNGPQTRDNKSALPVSEEGPSEQQEIASMRSRAEREVFGVARALAAERMRDGKSLSDDAIRSTTVDAIAEAMSQTPHSQIKPEQKQLLFRTATAAIRGKANDGVRAGIRDGGRKGSALP